MRTLMLLAALALLGACASVPKEPVLPKTVTVTVEKYRELPAWATAHVEKPMPADGSVGARVQSNDARGNVIDYDNCLRDLLAGLVAGHPADLKTCSK